jgi:hypothetical protein
MLQTSLKLPLKHICKDGLEKKVINFDIGKGVNKWGRLTQ